ncbi:protein xpaC [Bacillus mangrovi]|uniref:Protein xpaC n=1 Tax=Metabacillus mangrovi TaxID=1491830 RepID=A0A7X2S6H3_9BACI|nr:5-bromo-4-chloroindolyl phosphate hydrolysis family protein [Metabacillus mangrovi]MTH53661.1 protein xpaC [Metabacillus mangrovi]
MNRFITHTTGVFVSLPVMSAVWLTAFFPMSMPYLSSSGIALAGGAAAYGTAAAVVHARFLKKSGLTRSEYRYIQKNVKEAKQKMNRLSRALFSIRSVSLLKQTVDLLRVVRRICKLAEKEPQRFYKAESFFYNHLDSAVEITERYAFLSLQPKKNSEIQSSLKEANRTLKELTFTMEEDLFQMLSDDISSLKFENTAAKHAIDQKKDLK